jgi:hypothetical protein
LKVQVADLEAIFRFQAFLLLDTDGIEVEPFEGFLLDARRSGMQGEAVALPSRGDTGPGHWIRGIIPTGAFQRNSSGIDRWQFWISW